MVDPQLIFYGVLVSAATIMAWLSRDAVVQQLALLLLTAWALSNAALAAFGYAGEPYIVPSLDGAIAVAVAWVGYRNRSRPALVIFLLYAFLGGLHLAAWLTHREQSYAYYGAKNLVFIFQVITVGVVGGDYALRRWSLGRFERARAHRSGR